jgi:DNA-binding GntR family transcriptional regulator
MPSPTDGELAELLMRRHIGASKRNIARHYPDGAPNNEVSHEF